MNDFLENPEERIAGFSNSTKNKLSETNEQRGSDKPNQTIPLKKEKRTTSMMEVQRVVGETIQIRISRTVEQRVREALWNYNCSTGKKMGLREFADQSLLEYIKVFEKK